jgi:hypothetical protein
MKTIRAARVGLRDRVHDVIRADDQRHVDVLELGIRLLQIEQPVVRHVRYPNL